MTGYVKSTESCVKSFDMVKYMVGFIDEIEIRLSPIVEVARVRTPLIKGAWIRAPLTDWSNLAVIILLFLSVQMIPINSTCFFT